MPNICFTSYRIVGDKKDIEDIHNLLNTIRSLNTPLVPSDFGSSWLGCVVSFLGGDVNTIRCRGAFSDVCLNGEVLSFCTETAWEPCNEVLDLLCRQFPSIRYFYYSEEEECDFYVTNDEKGDYFTSRVRVNLSCEQAPFCVSYFDSLPEAYRCLEDFFNVPVKSTEDVERINTELCKSDEDCYVEVVKIKVVNR